MPRFFVPKADIDTVAGTVRIYGDDARHIARSLRMASGEGITVCDGEGTDYRCTLGRIRDDCAEAVINASSGCLSEPPYFVTVCQALVKRDKMETVIQKSVECGASHILPFESSRCIMKMKENSDARIVRWNRIAAEAAKQCGRGMLPRVDAPVGFAAVAERVSGYDLKIFCYEDEHVTKLSSFLASVALPMKICIAVGPEGGFSPEEAEYARKNGFVSVTLGPRILRTESAAPFALAAISTVYE